MNSEPLGKALQELRLSRSGLGENDDDLVLSEQVFFGNDRGFEMKNAGYVVGPHSATIQFLPRNAAPAIVLEEGARQDRRKFDQWVAASTIDLAPDAPESCLSPLIESLR